MPVKSFKFVSPGVFINEIDNSFRPRRPDAIGPVVIGRSVRGLAMQPVKLESFSDFLTMYGDTVPGNAGGDVYRDGNYQSPMYGTYAAKAFLNASVAPVTYMRLLGTENTNKETGGEAGWKTTAGAVFSGAPGDSRTNGGAYGLWVFPDRTFLQSTCSIAFADVPVANQTITLISTDGTSLVYTAKASETVSNRFFRQGGSVEQCVTSLKACIDAETGHNGRIIANIRGGTNLDLTQSLAGNRGNTTITENLDNVSITPSQFFGGTADLNSGSLSAV